MCILFLISESVQHSFSQSLSCCNHQKLFRYEKVKRHRKSKYSSPLAYPNLIGNQPTMSKPNLKVKKLIEFGAEFSRLTHVTYVRIRVSLKQSIKQRKAQFSPSQAWNPSKVNSIVFISCSRTCQALDWPASAVSIRKNYRPCLVPVVTARFLSTVPSLSIEHCSHKPTKNVIINFLFLK